MDEDDIADIALWMAFERLDHYYLIHDDEGVGRELVNIQNLRQQQAEQHG